MECFVLVFFAACKHGFVKGFEEYLNLFHATIFFLYSLKTNCFTMALGETEREQWYKMC